MMDFKDFALTFAGVWTFLILLYILTAPLRRPKKVEYTPPPAPKTFIEEVLDASLKGEDPPQQPGKPYTWEEYLKDLFDNGLTFDEIYEKSGGRFPVKPEAPPPVESVKQGDKPAQGSPMAFWVQGADGQPGGDGHKGADGQNGRCPDSKTDARMKELQDWFKQRGEDVPLKKLVPPPPAPHTVIHRIYTRRR